MGDLFSYRLFSLGVVHDQKLCIARQTSEKYLPKKKKEGILCLGCLSTDSALIPNIKNKFTFLAPTHFQ